MPTIVSLDHFPFDPQILLDIAGFFSDREGTALLYSGGTLDSAENSYLALFPFKTFKSNETQENPWDVLKDSLPKFNSDNPYPEFFGFLSYEMGAFADIEKPIPHFPVTTPYFYFQKCAIVLAVDHKTRRGTLILAEEEKEFWSGEAHLWGERLKKKFEPALFKKKELFRNEEQKDPTLSSPIDRIAYLNKIAQAKEYIAAGDIYQVNLSQQFLLKCQKQPFSLFIDLVKLNPAPFSAFFNLGQNIIVSSSPERFLRKKNNRLETRPIKGTAPRGKNSEEDAKNKELLLFSEKERAELLMITDLMRNDLGKVSSAGSVQTKAIWRCESYTNVFHLLSIIESVPLPNLHPIDLIRSCFPGGSITGCPKLRAMEVIAELEERPRGIYTGSIGYLAGNGDFDFNIAIRTAIYRDDFVNIQLGGGIVSDSNPEKEYEEILHKGKSIFKILGFETL
jgi:para-aminobenzoate synthetase component 1